MIDAVRATGSPVLWVCDPMHGNTETTAGGIKTRRFDNILGEVEAAFRIHEECGVRAGRGAHRADGRGRHRVHRRGARAWPRRIWRGPTRRRSTRG